MVEMVDLGMVENWGLLEKVGVDMEEEVVARCMGGWAPFWGISLHSEMDTV